MLRDVEGVIVVPRGPADLDGGLDVKPPDIVLARNAAVHVDEGVELGHVLELGVAVEEQGGVIGIRHLVVVEALEVGCQGWDPLRVKELPDHVARLHLANGQDVLLHCVVIVLLVVQVVAILPIDVRDEGLVRVVLSELQGHVVEVFPEQELQLCGHLLLPQHEALALVPEQDVQGVPLVYDVGDLVHVVIEGDHLVLQVIHCEHHPVRGRPRGQRAQVALEPKELVLAALEHIAWALAVHAVQEDGLRAAHREGVVRRDDRAVEVSPLGLVKKPDRLEGGAEATEVVPLAPHPRDHEEDERGPFRVVAQARDGVVRRPGASPGLPPHRELHPVDLVPHHVASDHEHSAVRQTQRDRHIWHPLLVHGHHGHRLAVPKVRARRTRLEEFFFRREGPDRSQTNRAARRVESVVVPNLERHPARRLRARVPATIVVEPYSEQEVPLGQVRDEERRPVVRLEDRLGLRQVLSERANLAVITTKRDDSFAGGRAGGVLGEDGRRLVCLLGAGPRAAMAMAQSLPIEEVEPLPHPAGPLEGVHDGGLLPLLRPLPRCPEEGLWSPAARKKGQRIDRSILENLGGGRR